MKNTKLTKEIKEFFAENGIDNTEEKLLIMYGYAEFIMKSDTYWSPCENCDNPSCGVKENFPIWFCADQM